jgi:hypothetical protein
VTSILGDGVAANCCAHLLDAAGIRVTIDRTDRPKVPALLVGTATQALIADVFQRPDLFREARPIARRIVAWGPNAKPIEIPHSAAVIAEQDLRERLSASVIDIAKEEPDWTIYTSRPLPLDVETRHFGSRIATATPVRLREGSLKDACWIESLENGWLFLLPNWLLSVGAPAEDLLARSELVAAQIDEHEEAGAHESRESRELGTPATELDAAATAHFPAYPRISDPLSAAGWIACGSAAMAFDPICGDGTGNAIREAILASAVIRAAARGEDVEALLAHYRARLVSAFLKHLGLCRQFYAACPGAWWEAELAQLDLGIAWCRERLRNEPAFRYQLRGFELEPAGRAV